MAQIKVNTNYGEVTVRDAMLNRDETHLDEGVELKLNDKVVCRLFGFSAESFEDDAELVETYLEMYL